jgi:hypothetical protein
LGFLCHLSSKKKTRPIRAGLFFILRTSVFPKGIPSGPTSYSILSFSISILISTVLPLLNLIMCACEA